MEINIEHGNNKQVENQWKHKQEHNPETPITELKVQKPIPRPAKI